jgi:hypothetical protein
MSDIVHNALRYDANNTRRVDVPANNTGQQTGLEYNKMPIIGFDCSGYYYHVVRESGYSIARECTSSYLISQQFTDISWKDVLPGDMINFGNHIGIVISYDSNTQLGTFNHMNGQNNKGELINSVFTTDQEVKKDNEGKNIYYGIKRKIKVFRRVKEEYYNPELDFHKDGGNNNPVLEPIGCNTKKKKALKKGDKGPEVKKAQVALKKYVTSTPTHGFFERLTERAVKEMQRLLSLRKTGQIDKQLHRMLGIELD